MEVNNANSVPLSESAIHDKSVHPRSKSNIQEMTTNAAAKIIYAAQQHVQATEMQMERIRGTLREKEQYLQKFKLENSHLRFVIFD